MSGPVWAVVSMVPVNYLSVCVLLEVSGPVWAVVYGPSELPVCVRSAGGAQHDFCFGMGDKTWLY